MALRKEKIAGRLGELRERDNLTQEQAAQRVGITVRQWQRWETGESVPYPRNLDVIASKFGITVQEFFDEQPLPPATAQAEILERLGRLEGKVDAIARGVAHLIEKDPKGDVDQLMAGIWGALADTPAPINS